MEQYLVPKLVSSKWFSKYEIFQKASDNVVVVNKTEQVTVSEDQTISRYSNSAASSVVEIVSRKKNEGKAILVPNNENTKIGNGVVVTADGLVITPKDALITEKADYEIFTSDNQRFDAKIMKIDPFSDMAVLKLENAENLSVASFISSEDIKVGAKVVAIGKIGSGVQTVFKSGLISRFVSEFSLAGPLAFSDKLQGVYFTDFELANTDDENFLGSAVADYNGNIVGILAAQKTGSVRQYFIIPINYVADLANGYITSEQAKRGSLGIYYQLLSKEKPFQSENGQKFEEGALVFSPSLQQGLAVISGSAAERAGIKIFDIIFSVNGENVGANQSLARLISKYKPGEEIELKINRGGEEILVKTQLK